MAGQPGFRLQLVDRDGIDDERRESAGLLRDGKGSTWEGGMRVPGIAWWPGAIPAGRVEHTLACLMDLYPTCARLAGADLPADRPLDGVDIAPLLRGTGPVARGAFFYYRGTQLYAVRQGDWKAHFITRDSYGPAPAMPHDPPLLFNLVQDPSERFDVAAQHPDVLAAIRQAVEQHRAGLQPAPTQLEATRPK